MKNEEIAIKQHTVFSCAIQLITHEYPEKFWSAEKISGSMNDNIIKITGDLDIFNTEVYEKSIEFNGKRENYKIILQPQQSL